MHVTKLVYIRLRLYFMFSSFRCNHNGRIRTGFRVQITLLIDDSSLSVVLQYLGSFFVQYLSLDFATRFLQLFVRFFKDGTFIETNRFGVAFRGPADNLVDARPQRRSEAHDAGFTRGAEHVLFLCGRARLTQRKRLQLFLGKLNGRRFPVQRRVVERRDPVGTDGDECAGARLGAACVNGRAKGTARSVKHVLRGNLNGDLHHFFVGRKLLAAETRFVLVQPFGQANLDTV